MADNKVKFLRGTSAEYEASAKDNDVFYYITDTQKLYLGTNEVTGDSIAIDDTSTTDTNKTWSAKKINESIPTTLPASGGNADTLGGKHASDFALSDNPSIEGEIKLLRANNATTSTIFAWDNTARIRNLDPNAEKQTYTDLIVTPDGIYTEGFSNGELKSRKNIADGGNADLLDGLHANEIASNPNLLINPDFAVNQRGKTSYSGHEAYGADCWCCQGIRSTMTVQDGGVRVGLLASVESAYIGAIKQKIDRCKTLRGRICTVTVNVKELAAVGAQFFVSCTNAGGTSTYHAVRAITGAGAVSATFTAPDDVAEMTLQLHGADMRKNGETADSYTVFEWAKLELGSAATPFIPPEPNAELLKCQRYYQLRSSGDIAAVDMRPSMNTITDIKQREDGNYEYIAE